ALSMILCGDRPYCWRLPGIIEGAAIPVILYIGYALSRRDLIGPLAGFVAALAAASSLSIRYEASVAMLDIHQAFFTSIAIAALASESVSTSIVAAGLASSVKYSGAFIIPAIWAYTASRVSTRRKRAIIFLETIAVPPLIVVALSTPLILHFGWKWFWENSVVGALKWHTTSRPAGPPVSSPGGWLVNANPFYFDYDTLIGGVTNSVLQVTALVLGGATIIYSFWRSSWPAAGSYTYYSIIGMYLLLSHLYIFHIPGLHGNTTLYSFYAVQLAPSAAATYGDLVASHAGGDVEASAPTTRF
nr:hypothetical protein [Desulfurococcales archaeon]